MSESTSPPPTTLPPLRVARVLRVARFLQANCKNEGSTYLLQREPSEPTDYDDETTNTNPSGLDSPKRGAASGKQPLEAGRTPPVVRN